MSFKIRNFSIKLHSNHLHFPDYTKKTPPNWTQQTNNPNRNPQKWPNDPDTKLRTTRPKKAKPTCRRRVPFRRTRGTKWSRTQGSRPTGLPTSLRSDCTEKPEDIGSKYGRIIFRANAALCLLCLWRLNLEVLWFGSWYVGALEKGARSSGEIFVLFWLSVFFLLFLFVVIFLRRKIAVLKIVVL